MSGKKFVIYFVLAIVITGIAVGIWIKQGYDSRPDIKIEKTVK